MTMTKKGEVGQLSQVLVPVVIIAIIAIAAGLLYSNVGTNYGVTYDNENLARLNATSGRISELSGSLSNAVINPNQTSTNVLTASERLFSGAYNSILLLSEVPSLYTSIVSVITDELNIPIAITNMIIAGVIFAIIGTVIYLILGRR